MTEIYNKDGIKAGLDIEKRQEHIDRGSESLLRNLGEKLSSGKDHGYMGSACFHVYRDKNLGQIYVKSQTSLEDVNELVANMGIKELAKACMAAYGRKVPELRGDTPWEEQEKQ